jgi:hypothetical protein
MSTSRRPGLPRRASAQDLLCRPRAECGRTCRPLNRVCAGTPRYRGYTSIYGGHTSEPGPPAPRLVAEITRIEGTHRYLVTDHGLDTAKFLTCLQDRVLRCGLAELATATRTPGRLRSAATAYRTAVENHGSIIRATKHQPPQPHSNTNQPDPHTTDLTQKSGFAESSPLEIRE